MSDKMSVLEENDFQATLMLPLDLSSASQAREFVRMNLNHQNLQRWVDQVELIVTELVSNSVLHARTRVELTLQVKLDHVRVEVTDYNPTPPVPKKYDNQATTGRGLGLVALIADSYGVCSNYGNSSKTVWATVSDNEPGEIAQWEVQEVKWPSTLNSCNSKQTVVLQNMPEGLWRQSQQHTDALLREYTLKQNADPKGYPNFTAGGDLDPYGAARILAGAKPKVTSLHQNAAPVTVELQIPVNMVGSFNALKQLVAKAELMAVCKELLTVPAPVLVAEMTRWAHKEVVNQLNFREASPWPGS